MRSAAISSILAAFLALAGCGGGGSPPVTADASSGGAPPPPGGPPSPGNSDGAAPSDGATPMGESPPPVDTPPDGGTPDGYVPPSDSTAGTPDGTAPGDPNNPGAEFDPNDPNAPRPPRPKTFEDLLSDALHAGNETEWLRLVRTNLIANPAAWSDQLQKNMAWVPALRRPALGPRFGVGVVYVNFASLPRDFEGSPQPIGSSELTAAMATFGQASSENSSGAEEGTGRRRRGKQADSAPAAQPEFTNDPNAEQRSGGKAHADLLYYTGDVGTKFLEALKGRIESGEYGAIYKQATEMLAAGPPGRGDPNNPDAAYSGEGGQPPGTNDGAGGRSQRAAGGDDRLGLAVVWLGKTNSRDELDTLAQKAGVDLLVTFDLTLVPGKINDFVNNKTRIRIGSPKLVGGKKEEPLYASATLENRVVMQAREKDKDKKEDLVDKEVAKAVAALDQKCKGTAFPTGVNPDAIKRRVAALVAEKPADPLPALVEARYYVVKGLLPEEDLNNAGMALMGGPEYARMVASAPGAGLGPQLGGALTLPSILNVLHGLNAATGAATQVAARPGAAPAAAPAGDGGGEPVRKGRGKGKGRPPM